MLNNIRCFKSIICVIKVLWMKISSAGTRNSIIMRVRMSFEVIILNFNSSIFHILK